MSMRQLAFAAMIALVHCATASADVDSARGGGIAYLLSNQNGDGSFKSSAGLEIAATASAADALATAGVRHGQNYGSAIAYLANADGGSVDSLARSLAALRTAGVNLSAHESRLLASRNAAGGWGAYSGFASSFPDTTLAIAALGLPVAGGDFISAACVILMAQRPDFSWSYFDSQAAMIPAGFSAGAIVPTAHAVAALQAYVAVAPTVTCNATPYSLANAIANGIAWLLGKRNAGDGGFGEEGASAVIETALAYGVLKAQASSPEPATSGALAYLLAQQNANGSWRDDVFHTAAVLRTFPATVMADTDKDGIPDASEAPLNKNPAVADSRDLLPGNGAGGVGLTAPLLAASGQTFQNLSVNLSAYGGTPPYAFRLVAGSLPPGLYLGSSGLISGTPTAAGEYDFDYAVTDAVGTEAHRIGRLSIAAAPPPPDDGDVPTLPEWGALALAVLLLRMAARSGRKPEYAKPVAF